MEDVIILSSSENEASLQCLTWFLELRQKFRLSCESVSSGPYMITISCFVGVESVPCFAQFFCNSC